MNVALPKGRLGEQVYSLLERAGYPCPSIREENRKLVFENQSAGVRYFWVKPSDVEAGQVAPENKAVVVVHIVDDGKIQPQPVGGGQGAHMFQLLQGGGHPRSPDHLQVLLLAARSLELISRDYLLDVSHLGFVSGLLDSAGVPREWSRLSYRPPDSTPLGRPGR